MGKKVPLSKYEKLEKAVGDNFAEEFRSAADDKVKNKIVELNNDIEKQIASKKDNQKIAELNASISALRGGYNDLIKLYRVEIKFLLTLLESRGKL